jgi:hypothetical protein
MKISSPLFSILSLAAILVGNRDHRTQFWKGQDGRQAQSRKKGDEILIVHCCFSASQNKLKF